MKPIDNLRFRTGSGPPKCRYLWNQRYSCKGQCGKVPDLSLRSPLAVALLSVPLPYAYHAINYALT